jgi:hypothetical protein
MTILSNVIWSSWEKCCKTLFFYRMNLSYNRNEFLWAMSLIWEGLLTTINWKGRKKKLLSLNLQVTHITTTLIPSTKWHLDQIHNKKINLGCISLWNVDSIVGQSRPNRQQYVSMQKLKSVRRTKSRDEIEGFTKYMN